MPTHTFKYSIGLCGWFPKQLEVSRPTSQDLKHHRRAWCALTSSNNNRWRTDRTSIILIEDTNLDSDVRVWWEISQYVAHLASVTLHPGAWVLRSGIDDVVNLLHIVFIFSFPVLDLEGQDIINGPHPLYCGIVISLLHNLKTARKSQL